MPRPPYTGRHRRETTRSRGHRFIVPVALFSSTLAAAVVVRGAGASELSLAAATLTSSSTTLVQAGLTDAMKTRPGQVDRGTNSRPSRDGARADMAARAAATTTAKAREKAQSEAVAATTAVKVSATAAQKAQAVGGGTGDTSGDGARVGSITGERRWVAPFAGYTLTSGYGWRWGRLHPAQDLAAPVGTPVRALSSGQVTSAGWSSQGYGYLVKIEYWDGTVSWYAHNSRLSVAQGQKVAPGQVVSYSGSTGHSTGPHLHLEIHPRGQTSVAPRSWLASKGIYL